MVGGSGASLKAVGRVLRGAQISARPMAEERDVAGEMVNARSLRGERVVSVLLTAAWCKSVKPTREVSLHLEFSVALYLLLPVLVAALRTTVLQV